VIVMRARAAPVLVMPHGTVQVMHDAVECASLTPNFIKCLVGEPRRYPGAMLEVTEHPMLEPFVACRTVDDAVDLLVDLRRSLTITSDESAFLELWGAFLSSPESLPRGDRWVERLCLRYAGQSPKRLTTLAQLALTLSADNERGLYNSLGLYADGSHYARVCRACTGHPPGRWRHMSQTFY
jgi:hypothetical protein